MHDVLRAVLLAALIAVTACAPRGEITVEPAAAAVGTVREVFVATSRGSAPLPERFGQDRAGRTAYAEYDISIPPKRVPGSIVYPGSDKVDPTRQMLTVKENIYAGERDFNAAVGRALRTNPGGRQVVVFVHGFNNNYAEGIYRAAQLTYDLKINSTLVHFSWPSLSNPLGYVYDRDSALFSRDALARLLVDLDRQGASEIVLVAHSMGAFIAMEAMRQLAMQGRDATITKLSTVILISPDIDVDVFRSQMAAIPQPPQPFVIFGSPRDIALKVSARVTGMRERLGNLSNTDQIADLPVQYLDVGAFRDGDRHFAVATSPELQDLIRQLAQAPGWLQSDRRRTDNPITGILLRTQDATRVILSPFGMIRTR
ncbi:MAG: alpha/beta fold hydrolase [Pseudomonadota bacterium]